MTGANDDALLRSVQAALEALDGCEEQLKSAKRGALCDDLHALLLDIATRDIDDAARRKVDGALVPQATLLKGALLKALRVSALHRGLLGLDGLLEQTRRLLAGAPPKGVASYLETDLVADIEGCRDARALSCVQQTLGFMTGAGRLKKELGGVDLGAGHKKSCRTAINAAGRALAALENERARERLNSVQQQQPVIHAPETDVRVEDRAIAEARERELAAGIDLAFGRAVQLAQKKGAGRF